MKREQSVYLSFKEPDRYSYGAPNASNYSTATYSMSSSEFNRSSVQPASIEASQDARYVPITIPAAANVPCRDVFLPESAKHLTIFRSTSQQEQTEKIVHVFGKYCEGNGNTGELPSVRITNATLRKRQWRSKGSNMALERERRNQRLRDQRRQETSDQRQARIKKRNRAAQLRQAKKALQKQMEGGDQLEALAIAQGTPNSLARKHAYHYNIHSHVTLQRVTKHYHALDWNNSETANPGILFEIDGIEKTAIPVHDSTLPSNSVPPQN